MRPVSSVLVACLAVGCATDFGIDDTKDPITTDGDTAAEPPDSDEPVPTETADTATRDPLDDPPLDPIPVAEAPVYANTRDQLFEVDPTTGDATLVGTFLDDGDEVGGMIDIAIDLQGRMYGGTGADPDTGVRSLYRIDPTDASVTRVCITNVDMTALTFTSEGRLIAGGENTLEAIDVDLGCAVDLILTHPEWVTSGDVVGLPDGLIYWTVEGDDGDVLVTVDPDSGLYATRGPISYDRLFGVGYDEDAAALYGFSADGEIIEISPASGASSLMANTADRSWWGATTNPVLWSN